MPTVRGFLKGNTKRFGRIRIGSGFTAYSRLFLMAVLESVPATIRGRISLLDAKLYDLRERLSRSITVRVGDVVYAVRGFEDLQVLNPDFEAFMSAWFQPKKGDVFIDIGSHVGKYAVSTAKAVGDEGLVIAVEPHPETFKALTRNAELNHLKNLLSFNIGAWNRSDKLKFHIGGSASEFSAHETGYKKSMDVHTKRMDELLIQDLKLKRVDWIKIDVEKAEIEVLEGLEETLQRYKPRFFIEVWGNNREKVQTFMKKQGYSMILVSNSLGSTSERYVYLVGIPVAN
jgi:FkbM family methyltransferase